MTRHLSITNVPNTDKFLSNFSSLYESNPAMEDNLLVCLMKSIVCKMTGENDPKYPVNVLNFCMAMHSSGNKQLFQYVSDDLLGLSLRHMQRNYVNTPSVPFTNLSHKEIVLNMDSMLKRIRDEHKLKRISFSVGIDAIVVTKSWQLYPKHQAIVGGGYPNRFVSIQHNSKEEIHELIQ